MTRRPARVRGARARDAAPVTAGVRDRASRGSVRPRRRRARRRREGAARERARVAVPCVIGPSSARERVRRCALVTTRARPAPPRWRPRRECRNAGGRASAREDARAGSGGPDAGDGRRARTCRRANQPRVCRASGRYRVRRAECRARTRVTQRLRISPRATRGRCVRYRRHTLFRQRTSTPKPGK